MLADSGVRGLKKSGRSPIQNQQRAYCYKVSYLSRSTMWASNSFLSTTPVCENAILPLRSMSSVIGIWVR